jgi:succinate dehydrogenase/fumarate reductase cytochrome b subunit
VPSLCFDFSGESLEVMRSAFFSTVAELFGELLCRASPVFFLLLRMCLLFVLVYPLAQTLAHSALSTRFISTVCVARIHTALAFVHPDVAGLMCSIGNSSAAPLAKFAVSFPLLYHWLGGLRHTVWDKVCQPRSA